MTPTDPIFAVASYGLGTARVDPPSEPLPAEGWRRLLGRAKAERLTGFLAAAVANGDLPTTSNQADEALASHVEQMALCLALERLLLDTVVGLRARSIDFRVLKGPAVARLDYAEPSLRPFVDIDLLVPSVAFDDAARTLEGEGLTRRFPQPRPGFDRRFGKGATFVTREGLSVDLHRTLVFGPFGLTTDLGDLWCDSSEFTLANDRLLALDPEARLLHACLHAVIGDVPPRLLALRDVAQLAADRDPGRLREMTTRWRIGAVVEAAFTLAAGVGMCDSRPASAAWASGLRVSGLERRLLGVCTNPAASYSTQSLASVLVIPGLRNKLAYMGMLAHPDSAYLVARHPGQMSRWRSAGRQLRAVNRSSSAGGPRYHSVGDEP